MIFSSRGDLKNFGRLPAPKEVTKDGKINISFTVTPNDPSFDQQWALQDLANQADINAKEGWEEYQNQMKSRNGRDVVVAVIDTGVDLEESKRNS